jgi:hypothetical protein
MNLTQQQIDSHNQVAIIQSIGIMDTILGIEVEDIKGEGSRYE